ncbi:hypothetical protein F2P56_019510 [Juglans regia]|nr:hypothetical protein F2P56_019510 [Juglans regia]
MAPQKKRGKERICFMSESEESDLDDIETGVTETSSQSTCCIYRLPETLVEINDKKWFLPRVVSIGPYHRHEPRLEAIQKHKRHFHRLFLSRANKQKEDLMEIVRPLEAKAKGYYSEKIRFSNCTPEGKNPFLEMMILDGCFILELFRMLEKPRLPESNDPLTPVAWAVPHFYGDLLLLENQIPFFVLEKLFETSRKPHEKDSLSMLALRFFNKAMQKPAMEKLSKRSGKLSDDILHLLDLVRKTFITPDLDEPPKNEGKSGTPVIYCISKLLKAGIKIKLREADSFLAVKFKKGVIEMPKITLDYFMKSFLVNCRAFEQLQNRRSKHITVYAYFLDCLVNTAKDVEYLYERKIIDGYLGKNGEAVLFINKLGKENDVETDQFYLSKFFNDVNDHYKNTCNVQLTGFKHRYFNTPWSCISASAAFVLLVLTFLQTYYTIYAYVHPK